MNPVLKKIASSRVSRHQIADLVEKHIGASLNESQCQEACTALNTIRSLEIRIPLLTLCMLEGFSRTPCEQAMSVVQWLRGTSNQPQ
jgi:hypothetical protein